MLATVEGGTNLAIFAAPLEIRPLNVTADSSGPVSSLRTLLSCCKFMSEYVWHHLVLPIDPACKEHEFSCRVSSEKACPLVSRRRPCPKEQGLVVERSKEPNTEQAQIRTLLDRKRESKSSPNVRRKLRDTNSKLMTTGEMCTN